MRGLSTGDSFAFRSGRSFADNSEYAEKNLHFDILAISYETGGGYDGKNRWLISVKAEDREPEKLSLGSNPKRDEELRAAQAHLERGGTITNKRLRLFKGAYYLADGDG
jgi:hypothetical protein